MTSLREFRLINQRDNVNPNVLIFKNVFSFISFSILLANVFCYAMRFSIFDDDVSSFDLHSVNVPEKLTTIYFSLDSSKCNLWILQPIHQPEFSFYTTLAIEIQYVQKSSRLELESALPSSISTIC